MVVDDRDEQILWAVISFFCFFVPMWMAELSDKGVNTHMIILNMITALRIIAQKPVSACSYAVEKAHIISQKAQKYLKRLKMSIFFFLLHVLKYILCIH